MVKKAGRTTNPAFACSGCGHRIRGDWQYCPGCGGKHFKHTTWVLMDSITKTIQQLRDHDHERGLFVDHHGKVWVQAELNLMEVQ